MAETIRRKRKLNAANKEGRIKVVIGPTTVSARLRDVIISLIAQNSQDSDVDSHSLTLFVQSSVMEELVSDYVVRENILLDGSLVAKHRKNAIDSFINAFDACVTSLPSLVATHP